MASSSSTTALVSSVKDLEAFLSSIPSTSTIYLDLEGHSLGRHGNVSLMTILLHPQGVVKVIDVLSLGKSAFTTRSKDGKSLQSIFEDPDTPKLLWDVRNDADALWASYQIRLSGVLDVQLLELGSRSGNKTYLCGLEKAIKQDLALDCTVRDRWVRCKEETKKLMPTNVFAIRPVEDKTIQYCVNDVTHLPRLHAVYSNRIGRDWLVEAKEESLKRLTEARSPTYNPQSTTKALGPWVASTQEQVSSMDELLEHLEDLRIESLSREIFGDDDIDDYYDDGPTSCRDIIWDEDYYLYYSD